MIESSNSKLTFSLREEIAAEGQRRKEAMDKLWERLTAEVRTNPPILLLHSAVFFSLSDQRYGALPPYGDDKCHRHQVC